MDWIDALILGIVQGLSEYLPISSSGHLEIFKQVLGLDLNPDSSLEFSVMLHVATVLSTIVVLRKEFMPLCVSFFTFRRDNNFYYVCKILLSCIPVAIVGVFFKDQVASLFEGDLTVVGICLMVTAVLLSFAYFTPHPARSGRTCRQTRTRHLLARCVHHRMLTSRGRTPRALTLRHHHSHRHPSRRQTRKHSPVLILHGHHPHSRRGVA